MTGQDARAGAITAGAEGSRSTRRELVRSGAAVTVGMALAATGSSVLDLPDALAAAPGDGAVLVSLLRVEHVVVFAYQRALAGGIVSPPVQQVLTSFLDQEREHVHALSQSLTELGGAAPVPPAVMAAFESELRALRIKRSPPKRGTDREDIRFLIDLEMVIARRYRYAIERLQGDKQLLIAAEIMGSEAQHATVLRELLSPGNIKRAVPSGFVADAA